MDYEVEQKFPIESWSGIEQGLAELGSEIRPARQEIDRYFNHPARDFARSDEALRLRQREGESQVTYKGPKLDPHSKTRRELELPLVAGTLAAWGELLEVLGFVAVAEVSKWRRKAFVTWDGAEVEVSLDEVEGVGRYVELELRTAAEGLDAARGRIASLARRLGLGQGERRSYLELLLVRRGAGGD